MVIIKNIHTFRLINKLKASKFNKTMKKILLFFKEKKIYFYLFTFVAILFIILVGLILLIANNSAFANAFYSFIEKIVASFLLVNYSSVTNFLSDISMLLLGVTIPIFVFTVTLLGNAAKLAKEQKENEEQKNKKEFDEEIVGLTKELTEHAGDETLLSTLREKISRLEAKKKFTEEKLKEIENKYSILNLKNSVFIPGGIFIVSIFIQKVAVFLSGNKVWQSIILILGLFVLSLGVKKIAILLSVVQEVSIDDGERKSEELKNSLINALETIEDRKEPKPYIKFKEKAPFIFKTNTENEIEFEISLKKLGGSEAKNVNLWILSSEELEILPGIGYKQPFKQNKSYSIPNANTVIYDNIEIVRRNVACNKKVKIKATSAGNFKLRYMVNCDNHVGVDQDIDVIVQE